MQPGSPLEALRDHLLGRPGWMHDAACREPHPGVSFYPDRGESTEPAKAICARCLVRDDCLAYALETEVAWSTWGIWGGESAAGRRRLKSTNVDPSRARDNEAA